VRGQSEEGLNALTETLALVDKIREHFSEAELHGVKNILLAQRPVLDEQ
jgi:hypothetical protein